MNHHTFPLSFSSHLACLLLRLGAVDTAPVDVVLSNWVLLTCSAVAWFPFA